MFYDDVFQKITETGPFSVEGVMVINSCEYTIKGILCSGSYGQEEYDKGYSLKKTVKRQTFKVSRGSIPCSIDLKDLMRQTITIDGVDWIVDDITGNDSGMLSISLKGGS